MKRHCGLPADGAGSPDLSRRALPAGACDAHAHLFGPFDRFPLAEPGGAAPPLAPFESYLAMLDAAGVSRGVLIQPRAHGYDNGPVLDAIARSGGRLRGIAVIAPETPAATLAELGERGICGLRFTGPGKISPANTLPLEAIEPLAPVLRELGWQAEVFARCEHILAHAAAWRTLGVRVVIDHMGMFDVDKGVGDEQFQALLALAREEWLWFKLSVVRTSRVPDFSDVRPFHDALVEAAPDRLLWGSDWPFIGITDPPDAGALLDLLGSWVSDEARRRILVDNPHRLFFA